jgi:uncharacterized protein
MPVGQLTPIDQVRMRVILLYYDEIIKGFSNREHLAPLLKRVDKRIDDLKKVVRIEDTAPPEEPLKNFTVVCLKDVNIHIRKVLPLLLCKREYEEKKRKNDDTSYLNLIIDEAHNILSEESDRESEQWKDYRLEVFEEIIKEGRKFGVFVTLASQRPSDISDTIISQLHNYPSSTHQQSRHQSRRTNRIVFGQSFIRVLAHSADRDMHIRWPVSQRSCCCGHRQDR